MDIILKYFSNLSEVQRSQFEQLMPLYKSWNEKINVISRKDIDSLYLHHVLHSLSIVKYIQFKPGTQVIDLGTGGGFPGIPLAIYFPEVSFTLVDSIGKKVKVVADIANQLGLTNVTPMVGRVESIKNPCDFVVTRAVAAMPQLAAWSLKHISSKSKHAVPNGLIALKGPAYAAECKELPKRDYTEAFKIAKWFREPYFEEKFLVYLQGR